MPTATDLNFSDLDLHGGHPALDLVNTIDPRTGPPPHLDYLPDFEALVRWSVHAGLLDDGDAATLLAAAGQDPRDARESWRRVVALREALHRVVGDLVDGSQPDPDALAEIVAAAESPRSSPARLLAHPPERNQPALRLEPSAPREPADLLALLGRSALDLLTTADATRLRVCPGDENGCGWIVLDATRNRSRRWCDMAACGSSVKSKRLTERRRAKREEGAA